jgi:hypothetical protein
MPTPPSSSQAPTMSDEALGLELAPDETPENRARLVAALSPQERISYENLLFVAAELNAGRIPENVIVTQDRS